jgi:hypothetical protein
MITRWFVIHDWDIRCLFSFDKRDKAKVLDALFWADAPNSIVTQVSENINAGRLNECFCYSRPSLRRTVLGTGIAESGPEVLDSMVHEIFHICQHMAQEDGIDMFSEDAAYLAGDIAREISGIVCELSCPRCHKK